MSSRSRVQIKRQDRSLFVDVARVNQGNPGSVDLSISSPTDAPTLFDLLVDAPVEFSTFLDAVISAGEERESLINLGEFSARIVCARRCNGESCLRCDGKFECVDSSPHDRAIYFSPERIETNHTTIEDYAQMAEGRLEPTLDVFYDGEGRNFRIEFRMDDTVTGDLLPISNAIAASVRSSNPAIEFLPPIDALDFISAMPTQALRHPPHP